jgi:hypothetical protein
MQSGYSSDYLTLETGWIHYDYSVNMVKIHPSREAADNLSC